MLLRPLLVALILGTMLPLPLAWAETTAASAQDEAARIAALGDTMQIGPVLEVMREEGIDYGAKLEGDLFADKGDESWETIVGLIYDAGAMRGRFDAAFATALAGDPAALAGMQAFFGSGVGRRITTLEIDARRVLLDDGVEEAARLAFAKMQDADDPRLAALELFVAANDLIESNVMGALNANLAFYQAMTAAGAFGAEMTEDQMLADVWSQEDAVRTETADWLYPYLALAYKPLSDADLAAYQAFSESPAGQKLNRALFQAFDAIFVAVSRDLGMAAARQMQGEDL